MADTQKPKTECWQVIKVGKATDEFDNEQIALADAASRNCAAELLGVKARYVVIKQPE